MDLSDPIALVSLQVEDRCFKGGHVQILSTPWRAEYTNDEGQKINFVLNCLQIHGLRKPVLEDGSVDENSTHRIVYCQFADGVIGIDVANSRGETIDEDDDPELWFVEVEFRVNDDQIANNLFGALASALSIIDDEQAKDEEGEEDENDDPRLSQLVEIDPRQFDEAH